jgi:hypothetical protein
MNKLLILLMSVLCWTAANAQNNAEEAKSFGIKVVKSYFDNNCNYTFEQLHSTITSVEGGQEIQITPELKEVFCGDSPLRTDIKVSYALYNEFYTPKVLTAKEVAAQYPAWDKHLGLQAGDYLFIGGRLNAAGGTRLFKSSDMARFLLRKIDGKWKIVAI